MINNNKQQQQPVKKQQLNEPEDFEQREKKNLEGFYSSGKSSEEFNPASFTQSTLDLSKKGKEMHDAAQGHKLQVQQSTQPSTLGTFTSGSIGGDKAEIPLHQRIAEQNPPTNVLRGEHYRPKDPTLEQEKKIEETGRRMNNNNKQQFGELETGSVPSEKILSTSAGGGGSAELADVQKVVRNNDETKSFDRADFVHQRKSELNKAEQMKEQMEQQKTRTN